MGYGAHVQSLESLIYIKEVKEFLLKNKKHPVNPDFFNSEVTNPTLMIDWISFKVPFYSDKPINDGNVISFDKNGELQYSTDKHLPVVGSYDSKIRVRTEDGRFPPSSQFKNVYMLFVSGNPVKWFQGHNVFGSSDLNNLVFELYMELSEKLNCAQPGWLIDSVKSGHFTISRVDINGMYQLDSREDVLTWLRSLEKTARTRHGTAVSKGTTVYLGKNSERWTVKFYSKGQEIEAPKHQLPLALQDTSLPSFANNKLRAEITLRSKELVKLGLNVGTEWFKIDVWQLFSEYLGRVEMSEQNIKDELVLKLGRTLRSTYFLWKDGHDLRSILPKPTFYRHRKQLLEFGVDISVSVSTDADSSKVIPLRKILELRPCGVPDWAIGTPLYFEPSKVCG